MKLPDYYVVFHWRTSVRFADGKYYGQKLQKWIEQDLFIPCFRNYPHPYEIKFMSMQDIKLFEAYWKITKEEANDSQ